MPVSVRWFNPGSKVYWRGRWFDKAMVVAFTDLERVQGYKEYFYQGSYSRAVGASAGTHSGGAVSDKREKGLNNRKSMARRGIVSWHRTTRQGFMDHNHNMLLWDTNASRELKAQMIAWSNGRNGLASNGPDDSGVRNDYRHYLDWRKSVEDKPSPAPAPALPVSYLDAIENSRKYGDQVRPYYSVKILQRALNKIYAGTPLKESGVYGPVTTALYNKWRVSVFGAGPQSRGSVGPTGLKLLFKRAGMKVNVRAKLGGKNL